MSLFYYKDSKVELVGYANARYRSDPHKGRSQTGYIFTYGVFGAFYLLIKLNHVLIFPVKHIVATLFYLILLLNIFCRERVS